MVFSMYGLTYKEMLIQIITIFGGLGIFLYGIDIMENSLKVIAKDKLKSFIEKATDTPLKGIFIGCIVTAIIQSSSGTTALAIGFVRAGMMTFSQAVGVIMGANIGTTVTSFIIGLDIGKYALFFVGIGAILIFFVENNKIGSVGKIILGFGFLFLGLELMGNSLTIILNAYEKQAISIFTFFSKKPLIGLIIGMVITAIIQSSSATIGILQTLYSERIISLLGAIPILLGCNIGTTITAILASIRGGIDAKKTAVIHVVFNSIGAIIFMILLRPFNYLLLNIETMLNLSSAMIIAVAHMIFNVVSTAVLFFFIPGLIKITDKVIKVKKSKY